MALPETGKAANERADEIGASVKTFRRRVRCNRLTPSGKWLTNR